MINNGKHTRAVVPPVCRTPSDMHACRGARSLQMSRDMHILAFLTVHWAWIASQQVIRSHLG